MDEARKLAEEWELKYKEMHRQMADLDMARRTNMDKKVRVVKLITYFTLIYLISNFIAVYGFHVGTAANAVNALC